MVPDWKGLQHDLYLDGFCIMVFDSAVHDPASQPFPSIAAQKPYCLSNQ